MKMIEIGEEEEVLYPDEIEQEPALPVELPEPIPVELPWLLPAIIER